jgi:hypothetical protein
MEGEMGVLVPSQTRPEQQHPTTPPYNGERVELEILREQNQQLRELVSYLSRAVVRYVLKK